MQPTPALQLSTAVNWSIAGQLIDQFPAAVVVINSLPFRGRIDRLPPSQPHRLRLVPAPTARLRPAVLGYAVSESVESITRLKRHELASGKLWVLSVGGNDVLHR
jgi:hypothetical protein